MPGGCGGDPADANGRLAPTRTTSRLPRPGETAGVESMDSHPTRVRYRFPGMLPILALAGILSASADDSPLPPGRADRAEVRRAMESVTGPFPGPEARRDSGMVVDAEERLDGFRRLHIRYPSEPGSMVPAFLLLPEAAVSGDGPRRFPGVLALHQTHPAGNRVVVGLGDSPDDEYGVALVRRGWVVLAPPYPHLAGYAPDLAALGHRSGTLKAVCDNSRGLDLLAAMPQVRTNGFAAIGHSLGGHNGLFTAIFDPRIRAVASSCGFDAFRDYYYGDPAVWAPGRGWCQDRYMPGLAAYRGRLEEIPFDFPDVLAGQSDGWVWVNAPLGDGNFRWRSVARVIRSAWPAFAARDGGHRLRVRYPDAGHGFPAALREEAYRFLETALGSPPTTPSGAGDR